MPEPVSVNNDHRSSVTSTALSLPAQPRVGGVRLPISGLWLLAIPPSLVFIIFFAVPLILLFALAFNPSLPGVAVFQHTLTLDNFKTFLNSSLYYDSAITSLKLAVVATVATVMLGYPLSYFVAKERDPRRHAIYTTLVLISMQMDLVVRMFGLTVLFGNNGIINATLMQHHIISQPLPLMYNFFGIVVGLVQLTLPFMVLSLVGVIRGINPSLEEAARSLGASYWMTFFRITLPLSIPGILAGSLLVFGISVSSYVVPTVLGGYHVIVMPMQIYEQIFQLGYWQFGAAMGAILFGISLLVVIVYHQFSQRQVGGLL